MADSLEHAKKRLDDEYGQITRRFDEIHTAFDWVVQGKAGDDMRGLKDLEKKVHEGPHGGMVSARSRGCEPGPQEVQGG